MASARASKLLLGCNVYASEGRNARVVQHLRDVAAAQPGVMLAATFDDAPYNRTSVTLVSRSAGALADAAARVAEAALAAIDLRAHAATHPRLGAVDHVSCHPVPGTTDDDGISPGTSGTSSGGSGGGASPQQAAAAADPGLAAAARVARAIGARLAKVGGGDHGGGRAESGRGASSSSGSTTITAAAVPVYFYGAAHPQNRRLAEIRRALGYFGATDPAAQTWAGALGTGSSSTSNKDGATAAAAAATAAATAVEAEGGVLLDAYPPDLGPRRAPPAAGVVTVGATPWVVNFNVPLAAAGAGDLSACRRVARAVSERGGGLRGVEAMALAHAGGRAEVACNLLDSTASPPAAVLAAIEAAAAREGLAVAAHDAYVIGRLPAEIVAAAEAALPHI